ncbi:MAG: flagellar basal body rod protein FlgC [Desulfatiglans sp.]|nr:flagellar basal body rod protein FlgC [Thermodesulfobacteriota bacterium]MEE4354473.1 flagellar basal body rod protein FlgC [Desulfatiglans sp.]
MNFLDALHISSSGLTAQRLRMNVIASNLANIHTTRTAAGGPYKRKDVVFAADSDHRNFQSVLRSKMGERMTGVRVVGVVNDNRKPQLKYEPQHPDANEKGYVAMPNVNLVEEMVNMISATRSYEASVTAINATKSMAMKALEIGR